jgi:hypothetical protein
MARPLRRRAPSPTATCLWCGGALPPARPRYCSRDCAGRDHRAENEAIQRCARHLICAGVLAWDGESLSVARREEASGAHLSLLHRPPAR